MGAQELVAASPETPPSVASLAADEPLGAEAFARLYAEALRPHTVVAEDRCRSIYQIVRQASTLEGDMAELGVFRGGTSLLAARTAPHKRLYAFDTFRGIPSAVKDLDKHRKGDFDLGGQVPEVLLDLPNVEPRPGFFPDTAKGLEGNQFCYAHFDGDNYESCRDFLHFFYPRMVPGGVMVFDDWKWHRCRGVDRAVFEFLRRKPETVVETALFQAKVVKLPADAGSGDRPGLTWLWRWWASAVILAPELPVCG